MKRFSIQTEIDAPAQRVWDVMSDVERWPEWTGSITSVRLLGASRLEIGARALIKQPKFPPALWKVTAVDPGRGFTWVSVGPLLRVTAQHSITVTPRGSQVTLALEYWGLIAELLARFTRGTVERYLELEANGLKQRSESVALPDADGARRRQKA